MNGNRSARKYSSFTNSKNQRTLAALSAATSLVAFAAVSRADTYGSNGQLNLSQASSWIDESVPTNTGVDVPSSTDIAQWDSNAGLTSTTTFTLGTATTWDGISVLNPGAGVVIGNSNDDSNTLTLSGLGINMSAANQNLTINDPLSLTGNNSFTVDGTQTLNVTDGIGYTVAGVTLTFAGAGTQNVSSIINDNGNGGSIAETGPGTVVLTAANSYTGSTQLAGGVMELNFNAAGAPSSNILPSAAELRLEGGTLLINGSSSGGSQTFADTGAANGPTYLTPGGSIIQVVDNGVAPTVNLGTIATVDTADGAIDFVGPATSSDGLNATPIAATATINVGSTPLGLEGILLDSSSDQAIGVVGQPGAPNTVTDWAAALANGVVVGGSTISGFYTAVTNATGAPSANMNADIQGTGEIRMSSNRTWQSIRFNQSTGGQYTGFGNTNFDQFIVKGSTNFVTSGILITPNVGANNTGIVSDGTGGNYLDTGIIEPEGANTGMVSVFQYNTQGAFILDVQIHSPHSAGYAQYGPGEVELNSIAGSNFTLGTYLNGGLTIIGNYTQGQALGASSGVNLNGGNISADYSGTLDDGATIRAFTVNAGGSVSATTGNTLTIDGAIGGAGALGIGYGGIATEEVNPTTGTITGNPATPTVAGNLPGDPNTQGNGVVVLSNNTNDFTGGLNVNHGTLRIDVAGNAGAGPAGTGAIVVNNGASFIGNAGTAANPLPNAVTIATGGTLTPGDPTANGPAVGTMAFSSLTLKGSSVMNFAFGAGNSTIDLSGNLSIASGADLNAYVSGSTNPWTENGTWAIMDVSGTVSGLSNLSVLNSPGGGINYVFSDNSGVIDMTITGGSSASTWNLTTGGSWATSGNWNPTGVPNSVGSVITFGNTITGNSTVTLDGNKTVGAITFNSPFSYTINPGSGGTLTLQNSGIETSLISDLQGSEFINVPLVLASNTSLGVTNAANTVSISGAISGSGSLAVNPSGAGTVLLTGNNSYAGPTSIGGGTLQVGTGGSSGSLGTSTSAIANSGALIMDVSTNQSIELTGSGSLSQLGTGTLTLNGTNSGSTVALTNGEIFLATGASFTGTGDLTMGNATKLDLNGNNATFGGLSGGGVIDNVNTTSAVNTLSFGGDNNTNTFSGVIQNTTGTMSVIKNGTGTETISSVNTFSGGFTTNGGQVIVNQSNGLGTGTITDNAALGLVLANGVTLSNTIVDGAGSNEFADVVAGGSATFSGNISTASNGQFRAGTSNTTSTLNLTGTTSVSNIVIFTRGNVVVSGTGSVVTTDTASAILVGRFNGTSTLNLTLNNSANITGADGFSLGVNTAADDDVTTNVILNGSSSIVAGGDFEIDDSATSGNSYSVTLNGTSTLSATHFTDSTALGNNTNANLTLAGGTIQAAGSDPGGTNPANSFFMPWFNNPGNANFPNYAFQLAAGGGGINNGGFSITIGQQITDDGDSTSDTLAFSGSGTTTLANSNSYSAQTVLNAGTLVVANGSGSATSTGTVTLNGGTLASPTAAQVTTLNNEVGAGYGSFGNGFITGIVKSGSGANTVEPGNGGVGTLSVGGLVTNSNMTFLFDLGSPTATAASYTGSLIDVQGVGTMTVGAGTPITFPTNPTTVGDYPLFDFTSGITPSEFAQAEANFTLPSQPGFTYSLSDSISTNYLDLVVVVGGPGPVFWDNAGGSGNGTTWDTTSQNWNSGSAATTYANGDAVTFNDTNAGHYFVTLSSTVSPASVTVNSSGNYSITGGGLIVATGGFTKNGTSTLTLGVGVTASSFAINGGNVVLASGTTASSGWTSTNPVSNINVSSLTIAASSVLDITNNHIIIDYGASDPISTILGYLKAGFNNGAWNGTSGIISSTAQTKTNGLAYSIGWADGNDKTLNVKNLTSGEIELKYTLVGDANLDGTVNGSDFSILAANFGLGVTNWDQGNFLYTSSVNGSDFSALAANFGQGDSGAAVTVTPADVAALDAFAAANGLPAPTIAAVPEPATLGLLAMGATGLLARRRRKA
jgi:autotransporter-associated beta strand protein